MANFSELDRYLFGQATHYEIYRKLGAHPTDEYGIRGVCFDLWALKYPRVYRSSVPLDRIKGPMK